MVQSVNIKGYRFYIVNGEYYPSVTSILSQKYHPALESWQERLSEEQINQILQYTALRGEIIHYLALKQYEKGYVKQQAVPIESLRDYGQIPQMWAEVKIALKLFAEFRQQYHLEAVRIEQHVLSRKYQYSGRVDGLFHLVDKANGSKTKILVDIKTSRKILVNSVSLQLSAYNKALNDWAEKLYCLLLHPGETTIDGVTIGAKKPYWNFKEVPQNFDGFKGLLEAFEILKPLILNREKIKT